MENSLKNEDLIHYIQRKLIKDKHTIITRKTLLFKENLIDSINILYLVGYIEKHLKRKITEEELVMSNFESVEAMIKTFKR